MGHPHSPLTPLTVDTPEVGARILPFYIYTGTQWKFLFLGHVSRLEHQVYYPEYPEEAVWAIGGLTITAGTM
jgi:hypothetical protein